MPENNFEQPPTSKPKISKRTLLTGLAAAAGLTILKACTPTPKEVDSAPKPIHLSFAPEDKYDEPVKLYEDFTEVVPGTPLFFQAPSGELSQVVIQYDSVASLYVRNMGIVPFDSGKKRERTPGEMLDDKIHQLELNKALKNGARIHKNPLKMHDLSERVGEIKAGEKILAFSVIVQLENWMGDTAGQPPFEKNKTPHSDYPDISCFGKGLAILQLTETDKNNPTATVIGYINDARVCQPQSSN
jgi:hypothetical protein